MASTKWSRILLASALSSTLLLAACSSSSGKGSATGSAQTASAGSAATSTTVAALKAQYTKLLDPTQTYTFAQTAKPAPSGKKLVVISGGLPINQVYANGTEEAAKALGWTEQTVVSPQTPEGVLATLNSILQSKPAGLILPGIAPYASMEPTLKKIAAQGTVIVSYAVNMTVTAGSPIVLNAVGTPQILRLADAQATAAVHLADGPPNVVVLTDPTIPAFVTETAEVKSKVKSTGGSADVLKVSLADIGRTIPSEVVTYLQAHPNVKYVLPSADDFTPGITQAISAAGLNVKVIGATTGPTFIAQVKSGAEAATTVSLTGSYGYLFADAIARTLNGEKVPSPNPVTPVAIVTKSNAAAFGNVDNWPNLSKPFAAVWGGNK